SVVVFVIAVGGFFIKAANLTPFVPDSRPVPPEDRVGGLAQPLWQFLSGASPTSYGMVGVFVAAGVVFFAYSGFEAIANLGEETKRPKRDLPLGLLGTLALATALYVAVCLVITGMVHYTRLSESDAVAQVFDEVGLGWAGVLVGVAAVCGLSSVILVDIVAMGRIGFALARDGLLPPVFSRVHPSWGTPVLMTALTTAVVLVLAAFVPLEALAEMVSIGTLFAFFVVSIAVPVLRRTRPGMERPFRTPLSPVLPVVSALCCVALMSNLAVETWLRFVVWLVLGLLVYVFYSRNHARLARR
ncbi:MAG: APC family permease, partial [Nocardioidaceae bacterium]